MFNPFNCCYKSPVTSDVVNFEEFTVPDSDYGPPDTNTLQLATRERYQCISKFCQSIGAGLVGLGLLLLLTSPFGLPVTLGIALIGLLVFTISTAVMAQVLPPGEVCAYTFMAIMGACVSVFFLALGITFYNLQFLLPSLT